MEKSILKNNNPLKNCRAIVICGGYLKSNPAKFPFIKKKAVRLRSAIKEDVKCGLK